MELILFIGLIAAYVLGYYKMRKVSIWVMSTVLITGVVHYVYLSPFAFHASF